MKKILVQIPFTQRIIAGITECSFLIPPTYSTIVLRNVQLYKVERLYRIIGNDRQCTIIASGDFYYLNALSVEEHYTLEIIKSDNDYWIIKPEEKNNFLREI